MATSLVILTSGCAETLSGTVRETIDKTIDQAETAAKDKLGSITTDAQARLFGKLIDADLNTPFDLKYDQTAVIRNEGFRVKFSGIEDSRCPSDVQCIQAGRITAQVTATKNDISLGTYYIIFDPKGNISSTQKIDIYTVKLNSALPSTFTSTAKPLNSSYSVNLTVTK